MLLLLMPIFNYWLIWIQILIATYRCKTRNNIICFRFETTKKKRNCLWWPGDGYAFDWIDYIGTYFLNNLSTVQLRKNNAMRMRWTKMLQTNLYAKHFAVFFPDFCRYCCQYSVRPRPTFDCLLLFRWMNWKFLFRFGFDAKNHQHLP